MIKRLSLCLTTLVMAFQLTAGMVLSSLPASVSAVATVAIAVALPVTQTACSQDQLVTAAKDVVAVVSDTALQGYIRTLAPGLLQKFLALLPSANSLVAAFQNGDKTRGLELVNAIFPVIEEAMHALISLSPAAMATLGLANIGLHFILSSTKDTKAAKAARAMRVPGAAQASNYGSQRVWGCDFVQDRRCAALAH